MHSKKFNTHENYVYKNIISLFRGHTGVAKGLFFLRMGADKLPQQNIKLTTNTYPHKRAHLQKLILLGRDTVMKALSLSTQPF